MIQKTLPALLAACAFFPTIAAAAEAEPALAIVTGVAPGDLLNVRADASPLGHTRTRLANGASVRNSGCGDFNGYQWCKVAVVDQPGVDGWVPERYLLAVDPEGTATPTLDEAGIRAGKHDASASAAAEQGDAGGEQAVAAAAAVPPNLAARLGDGPPAAAGGGQESDAPASLTAAETEAYRVAYAARAKADATPENDAGGKAGPTVPDGAPARDETPVTGDGGEATAPQQAGDAADVPVPTPRPDLEGVETTGQTTAPHVSGRTEDQAASTAPAADGDPKAGETPEPQIVALADPQSSTRAWDATGEIPCARYVGQPMTRCTASVRRGGDGKADVTVAWPDGGTRVIGFYDGKPAGANSRGEFRFTREGDLNMIRVGVSERFEITDALAFGD